MNRLQKFLKIWHKVPKRIRNPWKKWCAISSSEEGDIIKTITKKQCSTPANLMNRLNWMATGCKIFWKFDIMFLEELGIHEKKVVHNFEFGKGRYDQNNYQKSVFYTGWLDEPDANRSNRLQKNLKIWQNVPRRVRNPWKKTVCNSKFEWGSYDQNKPECSEPQHAPINSN